MLLAVIIEVRKQINVNVAEFSPMMTDFNIIVLTVDSKQGGLLENYSARTQEISFAG
jgi:hypothetical protein